MKKTIHILFLSFGITFGYSQEYSKSDIEKRVIELTEKVTDTVYFDYKNGEELENPNLEFWINDNLTGNILSTDVNFSDNEMYSIFQKIYESGNESDFLKMYDSENPSIRVYGFWAFVKNKKYGEAKKIMHLEKNTEAYVYWNSAGCELQQVLTADLMKDLIKRMKKYGS